jgi:uncharacterized membrane protein YbhN (UPF0104 family)
MISSRHALLAAKLVLSIGLVWYVAGKFDIQQALGQLRNLTAGWFLLIIGLYYVQLVVASLRFREFLGVFGTRFTVWQAVDATLIGYFFSQTFISFVGGDAMRVLRARQSSVPLQLATKAVILDRASGFATQVVLILIVLPFALPRMADPAMRLSLILLVLGAVGGALAMVLAAKLPAALRRLKVIDAVADISLRVLRRITTPRGFAAFFGYSLAINFGNILLFFAIAQGLGIHLRLVDCIVLLPPVFFISMLPISISGWGVREGATVVALGIAGIPAAESLAISICFGLGIILTALPGGILWLFVRKNPAPREDLSNAQDKI